MNIEIPVELLSPTIEELEERTAKDLARKWKPCKRPGKKERLVIKQEREVAKLKAIAEELDKPKQPQSPQIPNRLSSLFVQKERPKFSLAAVNTNSATNGPASSRPTLRVSLEKAGQNKIITNPLPLKAGKAEASEASRKRGRPPKVSPL
ncbi:MAG: hypothetical protein LBC85_11750 [Fibromonadaceae bacterium]|jgi:hypothetical protein|nr:hypothetical protein [Fibromonadaceae bacterium]